MAGTENKTGTHTLADRLREEGRLSLDLLERFGSQLLSVVQWLEEKGISLRDLKPDNIGVSASSTDKSLALVVFDFSLADTPAENIHADTPQYLDPFLRLRRPPRWDVYAERFAAAMTLHEMATGLLPRWSDGATDPVRIDEEATIDAEWFDPSVRTPLAELFAKALARDYRGRFDSAEEMRHAWSACSPRWVNEWTTRADRSESTGSGYIEREVRPGTGGCPDLLLAWPEAIARPDQRTSL